MVSDPRTIKTAWYVLTLPTSGPDFSPHFVTIYSSSVQVLPATSQQQASDEPAFRRCCLYTLVHVTAPHDSLYHCSDYQLGLPFNFRNTGSPSRGHHVKAVANGLVAGSRATPCRLLAVSVSHPRLLHLPKEVSNLRLRTPNIRQSSPRPFPSENMKCLRWST